MTTAVVTVLGVVLVAVGVRIIQGRRALALRGNPIRVITSRYLGGKRFLTIVEVDGERLLLGLAGDRVSLVTRLPGSAPAAEAS